MTWHPKEQTTCFDQTPFEGAFFLHGDVIARAVQALMRDTSYWWSEGMKSPMVMFPSGEVLPVERGRGDTPSVQVFPGLELPLWGTFEQALKRAQEQLDEGWFSLFDDQEMQLEIWSHFTEDIYFVTYDNEAGRLVDVTITKA